MFTLTIPWQAAAVNEEPLPSKSAINHLLQLARLNSGEKRAKHMPAKRVMLMPTTLLSSTTYVEMHKYRL